MAGKKGRSGRRTKRANEQVDVLAGRSIAWGIKNWDTFDTEQKLRILGMFGPKYVVQQLQHTGNLVIERVTFDG